MLIIPTAAVPSQILLTQPADQPLTIALYQKSTGLYCDIAVATVPTLYGVLCRDRKRMVRDAYFGVTGDLMFVDQQSTFADPYYTGLGAQFLLYWLSATDIAGLPNS
jgi:hypothetical protein